MTFLFFLICCIIRYIDVLEGIDKRNRLLYTIPVYILIFYNFIIRVIL